jgi:hypothetical protein
MPEPIQPIQEYYPSARVRLILRFEDYGKSGTPEPPPTPPQLRKGKKDKKGPLEVTEFDGALLLIAPGDNPNAVGSPQEQAISLDNLTHVIDGIIPVTASWSQNGIRVADTLNFDINFAEFPIDPRAIRSVAVQFFLGTVSAEDFQRGIDGDLRTVNTAMRNGVPYNVIPDVYTDSNGKQRSNLRFEGWADHWRTNWAGGPVVSFECTDNTRMLISQEHPPQLTLAIDEPLDYAVANYLSNFPRMRGLSVQMMPAGTPAPMLKESLTKNAYPPGVGPSAANGGDGKLTTWDYLTDVVSSVGFSLRMVGTRLVIQRPRALYNRRFPPRPEDPFQSRNVPMLGELPHRLMLYGQNVQEMEWSRDFAAYAPINVEVRCYQPSRKKTLIARYPEFKTKRLNPGESADTKYIVHHLAGINEERVLRAVAQQIYETLGRNEIQVTVLTKNLASIGGSNTDPDLLDVQVGDAVDVLVHRGEPEEGDANTQTTIQGELSKRPQEFLEQLGFPTEFAAAYAKVVSDGNFLTTFRFKEIHIDWDANDGVRIDFDAVNYVEVRADAELPEDEEEQPIDNPPAGSPIQVKD